MKERNQARAQLAGAPLLVAQLDAMEFRNRMVKGDTESLRTLRLGTQTTVAEALKKLSTMPPLTLLQLCYGYEDFDFAAHLLRHADDLDFVQDTLTAVGMSDALNPILNGMLAGFNRRRRFQRFKIGHHDLELDRLRYAMTATAQDTDAAPTKERAIEQRNRGRLMKDRHRHRTCAGFSNGSEDAAVLIVRSHTCVQFVVALATVQ